MSGLDTGLLTGAEKGDFGGSLCAFSENLGLYTTDKLNRYNFFTSRFYSAVDIVLEEKPVVIMISQVHKTVKGKTPYSLIDPETEAIQIKEDSETTSAGIDNKCF